jgi:amino acid transporter
LLSSFGVICFGLVGLELASIMGDEIQDPQRTVPFAVAWGGVISGILYVGVTLSLLVAIPQSEVSTLQGIPEAVSRMSARVGAAWLTFPFALVLSISIAGIASAWLAGSARIPFVAGLDRYLPSILGTLHPRFATPYVALIVQGAISILFLGMSFIGAQVKEAFETLLKLAVVLQLVPFLYMFAALIRLASHDPERNGYYGKATLKLAGASGFIVTTIGMLLAFYPSPGISSKWVFEVKMWSGTLLLIALAAFFFFVYGGRSHKAAPEVNLTQA